MRINNNLMAMNTHRAMGTVQNAQAKSMEKLSSGYRINRAGDDAAGLAISEKMRGQIRGLNQASRNSQDGISMIQTAEGALNETQSILQRMRELAVQSANDTNVDADRSSIQNEIDQLSTEITRISDTTEFNTQKLLNGSLTDIQFQIGANEGQSMELSINDMRADALNVVSDSITVGTNGEAVKGFSADADFEIEGAVVTAVAGGAVGAKLAADSAGVSTAGFAEDVSLNFSKGITNPGNVTFDGADKIVIKTVASGSDIPWNTIVTSGGGATNNIVIRASGNKAIVEINVSGSGGNAQFAIDDAIDANADGTYTYDSHGVSFTLSAADFTNLTGSDIEIELSNVSASGAAVDFTSDISTSSNYAQTLSGATAAVFSGTAIAMDATDADWLGGDKVIISGTGLDNSGGSFTIKIMSGAVALSTDTYTISGDALISGVGTADSFSYDNHGVSFKIDVHSAKVVQASGTFIDFTESATVADGTKFVFKVSDDAGVETTMSGSMDAGEYGLQDIADTINASAQASTGTFGSDVAKVSGGAIHLVSQDTGSDSKITITDDGGLSNLFTTATVKSGSDSSVNLTLTEADGDVRTATAAASDTSIIFTDAEGDQATLKLKGYSSLDGVNVPEAFSASTIARTTAGIDVSSKEAASTAITTINDAIETVSSERSKLGAIQNRLEHTIANLDTSAENLQASESRIRDVDMAKEMMEFTKNNILQQAAQSMLAQANQAPQGVLQLLR